MVARPGPAADVLLLDHDQPAAYCVPGRRRIVLSTGALRCLDGTQLEAVLAHERAHLRQRHHLVLEFAAALGGAFPRLRLFTVASTQLSRLVEMAADDAAARRAPRLALAQALLALAAARVPAGALGAGGTVAAAQRVRRLIEPPNRPGRKQRAATSAAAALAVPVMALIVPATAAALAGCPTRPAAAAHQPAVVRHVSLAPPVAGDMARARPADATRGVFGP